MQDLWRKTAELSREHPILWLPLVCVGLIDISLQWFKKAGTSAIVHSLTTGHSVLGGEVPTSNVNSTILAKVALLSGPLTWGSIFVQIFVYTAAFVLTAAWVAMILRGEEPSPASAQPTLMRSFRSSLFFSAKLLVCRFRPPSLSSFLELISLKSFFSFTVFRFWDSALARRLWVPQASPGSWFLPESG